MYLSIYLTEFNAAFNRINENLSFLSFIIVNLITSARLIANVGRVPTDDLIDGETDQSATWFSFFVSRPVNTELIGITRRGGWSTSRDLQLKFSHRGILLFEISLSVPPETEWQGVQRHSIAVIERSANNFAFPLIRRYFDDDR